MSKKPLGTSINPDLLTRVRATVKALQRRGEPVTLTSAVEDALTRWVTDIENATNHGHPYPDQTGALPRGRRLT